jgi:hypothetical protein
LADKINDILGWLKDLKKDGELHPTFR